MQSNLPGGFKASDAPPLAAASPSATGDYLTSMLNSQRHIPLFLHGLQRRYGEVGTFLAGPFRQHLQRTYDTSQPWAVWFLALALKYPELFGGVAALKPGIEPIHHWKDMQ